MPFASLDITTVLIYGVTLIIGITLHEFAHAKAADMFGDTTPRANGRVTLNPLAHLDPIGSLMMIFAHFGWGRPVPVNPYALNRRSPAALMWVSLAGPTANLLLAALGSIPLRLGWASFVRPHEMVPSSLEFLSAFVYTNLFLTLFNLVPLAPLDGEKIASFLLPPGIAGVFDSIRPYGPLILIALLFVFPSLGFDFVGTMVAPYVSSLMRLFIGTM